MCLKHSATLLVFLTSSWQYHYSQAPLGWLHISDLTSSMPEHFTTHTHQLQNLIVLWYIWKSGIILESWQHPWHHLQLQSAYVNGRVSFTIKWQTSRVGPQYSYINKSEPLYLFSFSNNHCRWRNERAAWRPYNANPPCTPTHILALESE